MHWFIFLTKIMIVASSLIDSTALPDSGQGNADQDLLAQESADVASSDTQTSYRQGRTLNPLNMFTPASCQYDERRTGTCMRASVCENLGGKSKVDSNCSRGTCCLHEVTCGGVIRHNNTYFVNPDFPENTTKSQSCEVIVSLTNGPSACHVRFDFKNFKIHDPVDGRCRVDRFLIKEFPQVRHCGYNNDTHWYEDIKTHWLFEEPREKLTLQINLGESQEARHWMINVAYIPCHTDWSPPRDCEQYFIGATGSIRSFNFHELNPESSLLVSMYYMVCIRPEPNMCFIRWTPEYFNVSTPGEGKGYSVNWFNINQGLNLTEQKVTQMRYGRDRFGETSDLSKSPAAYSENTPETAVVEMQFDRGIPGMGFLLHYTQLPCGRRDSWEDYFFGSLSRRIFGDTSATRLQNFTEKVRTIKTAEGLEQGEPARVR